MKFVPQTLALLGTLASLMAAPATCFAQETATQDATRPVALAEMDGKTICLLKPENTRIEFVGTHVGDDPKPRLGGFKTFQGSIEVVGGKPQSIQMEMEITSIWTEFDNLTKHLMNADFFEADRFPKSSFKSTSITVLGEGNCTVAGELTLHGSTVKIEFPAKYSMTGEGLVLTSEFTLDRTKFGMDKMTDGVAADVTLNVCVGQATRGVESAAGNGNGTPDESVEADNPEVEGLTATIRLPNMT